MGNARVEAVVEAVALEVDVFWHPVVEGVFGQVVTVQFSRQIRIPDVVDLGYSGQSGFRAVRTRCRVVDARVVG